MLGLAVFIYLFPISYVLGDIGPDRALAPLALFALFVFTALVWHVTGRLEILRQPVLVTVFAAGLIVANGVAIRDNIDRVPAYAKAWDARMALLEEKKESGIFEVIEYVEPLPHPGFLYSAELSTDTAYFSNTHLREALDLPFYVATAAE